MYTVKKLNIYIKKDIYLPRQVEYAILANTYIIGNSFLGVLGSEKIENLPLYNKEIAQAKVDECIMSN